MRRIGQLEIGGFCDQDKGACKLEYCQLLSLHCTVFFFFKLCAVLSLCQAVGTELCAVFSSFVQCALCTVVGSVQILKLTKFQNCDVAHVLISFFVLMRFSQNIFPPEFKITEFLG